MVKQLSNIFGQSDIEHALQTSCGTPSDKGITITEQKPDDIRENISLVVLPRKRSAIHAFANLITNICKML